nr:beta-eliminating lyase-related protein [Mycobacterium sp.]
MATAARVYNSVWQLRADTWCRLEDAAGQLARLATLGRPIDDHQQTCRALLVRLAPLELYWAYPGGAQFARLNRMFTGGDYDKFAQAVVFINHALTHGTYRSGALDAAGDDEDGSTDLHRMDTQPVGKREPLYFEVLVVESLSEAQERNLRKEAHGWRRQDDEFVYEPVVVPNAAEALIAARLNVNIQAVVIGRRFGAQATRDVSALAEFVDSNIADRLSEDQSYDERLAILAAALRDLRPELDLYLMTEVDVENVAGRLGKDFRRGFHAREGLLELHLSLLQGVDARYRTPFFSALKEYSQRPTGVFHALPISQGKSIIKSHWIRDMVDFYGLDIFMAETSATCGGLDSLLEPTGPLREAQQLAAETFGSRQTYFVTNGTSTANKIVTQSLVAPGDIVLLDRNCHQSHHYGMMLGGANVIYLEAYPLNDYTMYGAVSLREIKSKLLMLRRAGKLDRVKMIALTNCTFDGIVYDVQRVMEECLAIKADLVFLWDCLLYTS